MSRSRQSLGQPLHLVGRGHRAGGVGRAVDEDGLGPRGDRGGDLLEVEAEVGVGVDQHRGPAGQGDEVAVHHEIGVEDDHLVAGVDDAAEGQEQGARGARGDQDLAVGVAELGVDGGLDLAPKLGDALGDGVGVEAVLDGVDRGGLDGSGDVEVGQADREVDRVLHGLGHVERLADARSVDVLHPVGDPGVVHVEGLGVAIG